MSGYNLPDNVSASDPEAPWNAQEEPEQEIESQIYTFRGFYIPDYMMDGIKRYIQKGIRPGHFLTAIITNDLSEACGRADDVNLRQIPAYVGYFYNEAPSHCWGSQEKMDRWMMKFREEF
jgi:hypothetical protein